MTSETIHILLVDDHDLVREGIKAALRSHPELSVVAEARDGEEAVREAARARPDLVVMDIRMPGPMDGIEACREIRSSVPGVNVLMLTSYGDERAVMASILAGAGGFLLKEARTQQLVDAIGVVGRGGTILDSKSAATVIQQIRRGNVMSDEDRLASDLSERELKILDLIAEGSTNREIGEALYLSEKTVKHHVSDILSKLGLSRRVEAATFAIRRNARRYDQ